MKTLGKLILGIATIALTACGGGDQKSNKSELSGAIKIDGSSTVYPITEAVAEEFRVVEPAVNVTVGVSGTGGGFKKFMRGDIDINDASRPIKSKEATACDDIGIGYQELSVAYDGLAVLVHPENDWVDYLTVEELKKIWLPEAQGKVMYWSDVRESWPKEELHLFGPGIASGTYDYFAEAICGKKVGTRGDYTASEDDHVLVQGIATDKNGLGFFGLAYYEENKDKLKLVGVDNGKGVVMPSLETVGNGSYAPLSRPIFIYVSSVAAEKEEVKEFVRFYLESASSLVSEVGYIPLLDAEYTKEIEKFNAFIKK
jgi:phosphate transport system substrate-binding protein